MAKSLPSDARSEIAKSSRHMVDANRKHRDVTRQANKHNDGMARLNREDLGRGSRADSKK